MAENNQKTLVLWTEAEDQILRDGIEQRKTAFQIADSLPGRSREGVRHRKFMLGLVRKPLPMSELKWSAEEDAILTQGSVEKWPPKKLIEMLPKRLPGAIYYRARNLKLSPLTIKYQDKRTGTTKLERAQQGRPKQWDEAMADWAERTCLTCGITFVSWGKGNRMCINHRNMSTGMD